MDMYAFGRCEVSPCGFCSRIGGVALWHHPDAFPALGLRERPTDRWTTSAGTRPISGPAAERHQHPPGIVASLGCPGGKGRCDPGRRSVSSVLFLAFHDQKGRNVRTVFLTGFEPESGLGGPPQLVGPQYQKDDEIVLDKSFAQNSISKWGMRSIFKAARSKWSASAPGPCFVIQ